MRKLALAFILTSCLTGAAAAQLVPPLNSKPEAYPKPTRVPGGHSPRNEIKNVTGIRVSANGQPLKWMRDPLDVFAFHVTVPQGVATVDVEFQYVSATAENQG